MKLLGLIETSLLDWDGRVCAVVFTGGCNLRCPFCHNSELVREDPSLEEVPVERVLDVLKRHDQWRDGVVITGGEPMMHPEVFELCRRIKDAGVKVKMDSNGCFPYQLKQLIEQGLCDAVAMDVKAGLDKYPQATGRNVEPAVIRRSIRLLKESGIEYEFRTTMVPGLVNPEDIPAIGELVRGAKRHVLQHFEPSRAQAESFRTKPSYSLAEAEAMAETLRPFVSEVILRGKFV